MNNQRRSGIDSYITPKSTTEKCLGDISTHKVAKGQIWQNVTNPNNKYEILEVQNKKEIKIKACYEDFNTQKQCCDILDKMSIHYTLRDYILIKE